MKISILLLCALITCSLPAAQAQISLTGGVYSETFDGFTGGGANPLPGWDIRTGATGSSLGTIQSPISGTLRAWTHASGQAKNVSSDNISSASTQAEQNANTNRALGLRQTQSFGNPGISANFQFATTGLLVQEIKLDLLMLDIGSTVSTWEIQLGLGASPASFTTLGTWSDTGVFGSTTFKFDRSDFGSVLDNVSQAWFRVVNLTALPTSGTYDLVALDDFSITTTAVPEPTHYALGIAALLALVAFSRRNTCRG